jgi:TRAP-type C4-dicarboxylate transport system permease small subunit
MAEPLHRALDALYLMCIWVAGGCIVLMSVFIPWGVFTRYVLGTGSQWPEPISILLMVVFTFLGAAAAYRAGAHIAVAMLTQRLPELGQQVCDRMVQALMLALSGFMLVNGLELCRETWGQSIPELPWLPVGFTYLPVPLGGLITALFVLEHGLFGPQSHRSVVNLDAQEAVEL